MRRFSLITLGSLVLLGTAAAPVMAAAPFHEKIIDSVTDPDFCGTGNPVVYTLKGVLNSWEDQTFGHINRVLTNPDNGAAVVESFAGGGKFSVIDDGGGAYTIALIREGLPVQLKMVNGPLLARDAGLVAFYDHFDADDNYLGTDVEVLAGPHPFIESEELFCDLTTEALGL
jgi:hypothetical protein